MKVNRLELKKALGLAVRCLDRRQVIPELACVHLFFDGVSLNITATNQEQACSISVAAQGELLDVLTDGKLFYNLISRLPDEDLTFKLNGNNLTVRNGNLKFRTLPVKDFPPLPDEEGANWITFKVNDLLTVFKAVLCGTNEDEILATYASIIQFEIENDLIEPKFQAMSYDNKRIAVMNGMCDREETEYRKFMFPVYAARLLASSLGEIDSDTIRIGESANHFFAKAGNVNYSFLKHTAQFPDIKEDLNSLKFFTEGTIQAGELQDVVETIALFTDERTRSIKTEIKDNKVTMFAEDSNKGEMREIVNLPVSCEDVNLAYNADFLLPVLRFAEGNLKLSFAKNNKGFPLKLTPSTNGVKTEFIIQSMRF